MKKLFLLPSSKDCNFEKGIFGVDWFRERRKTISPKFSTSLMESLIAISVTRLGYLWRFIVTNFLKNTTKIYGNYLIKPHFWSENCYGYFLGHLWKNFAYFYSNIWPHCNLQLMTFGKLHEKVLLDKLKLIYLWILNNLALYEN